MLRQMHNMYSADESSSQFTDQRRSVYKDKNTKQKAVETIATNLGLEQ